VAYGARLGPKRTLNELIFHYDAIRQW